MATELPIPLSTNAGGENRDYATIYADLARLIPQLTPEWTYQGDDDFGTVLVQLVAYLGDHLHYRADAVLRDLLPSTAIHPEVVREMAEWLGYHARRQSPARVEVSISMPTALPGDLTIPARSQFAATQEDGTRVVFENLSDVVIPAGSRSVMVELVEGQTVGPVILGYASGAPFERFLLTDLGALFNWDASDFYVTVNAQEATFFRWPIEMTSVDLGYAVRHLRDDSLEIRFGNGAYGALLPPRAEVAVTYRRGGGPNGNVARGAVNLMLTSIMFDGAPVSLSVTSLTQAVGGQFGETVDETRRQAPAAFRSQNRLVTAEDYEQKVQSVPGVFTARAVAAGINGVAIYVVPRGATEGDAPLPAALKRAILDTINPIRMLTHAVDVRGATLVPIDVQLECFVYPNKRRRDVRSSVLKLFRSPAGILGSDSGRLGKHLRVSDMVNAVEDVQGLDYVNVLRYTRRPEIRWIDRAGDGGLSGAGVTITRDTREQTWSIHFLDSTTFSVHGSVAGMQNNLGTVDVGYTDDAGEIAFTIESGAVPFAEGDRGELIVSQLAWNIQLKPYEFPVAGTISLSVAGGIE